MAGHARYTAVLDACVLHSMATADALMSLAAAGLYAAKWARHIEAEWIGSVEHRLPMLVGRLGERRDAMREAVADWEVEEGAWRAVALGLVLPDAKDVHVLAAALAGHADSIVTTNPKDFPTATLAPLGIEAIHPDHFIVAQWDLEQIRTVAAFKLMRARLKKPEASPEDFAAAMERNGLPATAHRLREAAALI